MGSLVMRKIYDLWGGSKPQCNGRFCNGHYSRRRGLPWPREGLRGAVAAATAQHRLMHNAHRIIRQIDALGRAIVEVDQPKRTRSVTWDVLGLVGWRGALGRSVDGCGVHAKTKNRWQSPRRWASGAFELAGNC